MKTKLITIILFLLFVCSCLRTLPDEELTITRIPYNGKEIRIDGYYTGLIPGQTKYSNYIFFYSNGVVFSFGYYNGLNPNQMVDVIGDVINWKDSWGIFQIKNDSIFIQGWRLKDIGSQFLLRNNQYKIINDSTLLEKVQSGNSSIYYFKKFSPKPDSTNVFIK
jgi:hypothetical protein